MIDIPQRVASIRELVAKLDKPVDQVVIEARIVIATESVARELGGWSERVSDPNDVANAITRAKRQTEDGKTCLLEFVTSAETAFSHRGGAAANGPAT